MAEILHQTTYYSGTDTQQQSIGGEVAQVRTDGRGIIFYRVGCSNNHSSCPIAEVKRGYTICRAQNLERAGRDKPPFQLTGEVDCAKDPNDPVVRELFQQPV